MKAKKFFALFLAVVMVLSVSITAFAVNSDGESYTKGSITITNPQDGVDYSAYKIFDVTYVEGTTKYAYTIAPAWVNDVVAYATSATLADDWTTTTANGLTVTKVLDTSKNVTVYNVTISDAFSAADFGEKMKAAIGTKTADESFTNGVAENLDLGYYMVQPTAGALVSLTTTDTDVEITDKNEKPVVDKKIVGEESILICTVEDHSHDDACYSEKDYTTKSVGDKVEFELDTKVPDMTGYKTYFFVMNDTMTNGLTFNDDVVITIGGTKQTQTTLKEEDGDYTVKVTETEDGETNIRIVFNDMKTKYWSDDPDDDWAGEPIVIKYSATVNESAVMGTDGNSNSAKIEYSDDPNIVPEYTPKDPEDPDDPPVDTNDPKDPHYKHNETETTEDDPTGESESDVVTVYTAELSITKVDAADGTTPLTGAKFKIEGEKLNVAIVNETIYERDDDNGTYYRLKDGTYTQTAPYNPTEEEPEFTYVAKGADFEQLTYEETEEAADVGWFFSTDDGATMTEITDENLASVPAEAKIYVPTYNTVGLYYLVEAAESGASDTYEEVTEANAKALYKEDNDRIYYTQVQHKQSDKYENTAEKYTKVEVINKENAAPETFEAEGFVGNDGVITFKGLAEGTYYITELVAPDGYNILKAPVKVDVALVDGLTAGSYAFQATIDDADTAISESGSKLSFPILNSQGMELPETGGIGRTIFYILGGLLILGAGILLIVRKRMSFEA